MKPPPPHLQGSSLQEDLRTDIIIYNRKSFFATGGISLTSVEICSIINCLELFEYLLMYQICFKKHNSYILSI